MNEVERLARIEEKLQLFDDRLEKLEELYKESSATIRDIAARLAVRETLNGEFRADLATLCDENKDLNKELEMLKRLIWTGFGMVIAFQFIFQLLWR
ncbi:MAG: hypothetical protein N2Z58_09405 [Fervidobacterium sp.]|nr:hypothetical protein [Fervidobacterium sp.]